jgi:rSAM/selenodomain-associated transferase 2
MLTAIVPALDEAGRLPATLAALAAEVDEVVVVDGGSNDATRAVAAALGAVVVLAPRGRGPQLNAGAAAARGDLLWFVHADARVAPGSGAALRAAQADWGCFALEFDVPDWRLDLTARLMVRRAERGGACTGDMGMWMRRPLFDALGGFPTWAAFEDLDLSDRARAHAPCEVLRPALQASARRWTARGVRRTVVQLWGLRLLWRAGVPGNVLASLY